MNSILLDNKNLPFFLLFFFARLLVPAQQMMTPSFFADKISRFEASGTQLSFRSGQEVTAIVIQSLHPSSYYVISKGDTLRIPQDEDSPGYTYFLSLPSPLLTAELHNTSGLSITCFLIHSGIGTSSTTENSRLERTAVCGEPVTFIPQSEWRAGLPTPSYTRSYHVVKHHIVHHSAGSNTATNYTQVVRDIYLYHTGVNGWSDIGYNYLIAQDGSLYAGRDPGNGSQDLVRGAHFCGQNTGTMGICLLGNYETTTLSNPTRATLETLLIYSMINQGLDPFESFVHSTGLLGTLAGHRDGCSTLCPGENVYRLLEGIRQSVRQEMDVCQGGTQLAFSADTTLVETGLLVTIYNHSRGYQSYEWLLEGGSPAWGTNAAYMQTTYQRPGFYDVSLIGHRAEGVDTLCLTDYIHASQYDPLPRLIPNPLMAHTSRLQLDFIHPVDQVMLVSLSGQIIMTYPTPGNELWLPPLRRGIYLVCIQSGTKSYSQKLIVN